ncbi:pentapeptide repeat-containing protein [Caproiciproducens faecalis]|uniref:Pentapeptide repeat-containing protein n=1 Tax=Caproiciproducens faecalis TaxID=2820301 RepID=A0ABS7DN93_9FIRM|nr:pentapeptide repeat-containing protein [Caproiciproducens faecalis]
MALYCAKTDGFPADKGSGTPCKYLMPDFRCKIHSELKSRKMSGCLAYECLGAGQKTTQMYCPDHDWKANPAQAENIFQTFTIVFHLHQILWYLIEAFSLTSDEKTAAAIESLITENLQMTQQPSLLNLDIAGHKLKVNNILKTVIGMISAECPASSQGTDFLGKNFKKANLDRRDFSMSLLIAANLEGCSLDRTVFLGADLRDANIKNTDLSKCVFLTQMQINSAKGNSSTRLPAGLHHPAAW